jgi:hypothetical protein
MRVMVVVEHNFGTLRIPLEEWIARGPGPRALLRPTEAHDADTGAKLPLSVIPFRYRNGPLQRTLVRWRLMRSPW